MPRRSRPARIRARVLLLIATMVLPPLAGCIEREWQGEPRPRVEEVVYRSEVPFLPASAVVAPGGADAVRAFLSRIEVRPGEPVYYGAGPAGIGTAGVEALADRRADIVAALLAGLGVEAVAAARDTMPIGSADAVPVAVVRARTIVLPGCPDWTSSPALTYDNFPASNWGCATAVNLGLMVADPADLEHGRALAPADGEYQARSIQNYRRGRTKDLIRDAASSETFPTMAPAAEGGK